MSKYRLGNPFSLYFLGFTFVMILNKKRESLDSFTYKSPHSYGIEHIKKMPTKAMLLGHLRKSIIKRTPHIVLVSMTNRYFTSEAKTRLYASSI